MNRVILQLFAVAFCFAVVQGLRCYKCNIGLWDVCFTTQTTCDGGEQCFSGVGEAASVFDVKMKGCLAVAKCNKTEETTYGSNNTIYSMTNTCCDTDLCNAAPGTSGLSLALATVTALFMANILV